MSIRGGNPERAAYISAAAQTDEQYKLRTQKFKMFFSGLIFATLSFIGTHPLNSSVPIFLKITETISLISFLLSGLILLAQLAEYDLVIGDDVRVFNKKIVELIFKEKIGFWGLFIIGMGLMVLNRSIIMFLN